MQKIYKNSEQYVVYASQQTQRGKMACRGHLKSTLISPYQT